MPDKTLVESHIKSIVKMTLTNLKVRASCVQVRLDCQAAVYGHKKSARWGRLVGFWSPRRGRRQALSGFFVVRPKAWLMKGRSRSMGMGKKVVELRSPAISRMVCR